MSINAVEKSLLPSMSIAHPADAAPAAAARTISTRLVVFLAAAVAVISLNLYASQPLIGLIGPSLGMSPSAASLVTTFTLLGYAAGLVLLVPLVDLVANRRLIVLALLGDVVSLMAAALAPSATLFLIASIAIGFFTTAIQMVVPVAAALSAEATRGRIVGNVMSGLMVGTLLSRPSASLIAEAFGWRAFFGVTAALIAGLALVLVVVLPERRPLPGLRYGSLIASLGTLIAGEPVLRRRAGYQILLMASFSLFSTAVALRLTASPYDLGQTGIALFSLAAAGAAIVAPVAGRLADRGWTRRATVTSHATVIVATLLADAGAGGAWLIWNPADARGASLALLALAAFLLGAGVTADQILGRHAINMIRPEARGRINGLYTGLFFIGGSIGAALAAPAWVYGGWPAVCGLAVVFPVLALAAYATGSR